MPAPAAIRAVTGRRSSPCPRRGQHRRSPVHAPLGLDDLPRAVHLLLHRARRPAADLVSHPATAARSV